MADRHPSVEAVLQFFTYEHLPPHLAEVSKPIANLAHGMADNLGTSPELTLGLRKLLEAKDCFVRQAVLDKQKEDGNG